MTLSTLTSRPARPDYPVAAIYEAYEAVASLASQTDAYVGRLAAATCIAAKALIAAHPDGLRWRSRGTAYHALIGAGVVTDGEWPVYVAHIQVAEPRRRSWLNWRKPRPTTGIKVEAARVDAAGQRTEPLRHSVLESDGGVHSDWIGTVHTHDTRLAAQDAYPHPTDLTTDYAQTSAARVVSAMVTAHVVDGLATSLGYQGVDFPELNIPQLTNAAAAEPMA